MKKKKFYFLSTLVILGLFLSGACTSQDQDMDGSSVENGDDTPITPTATTETVTVELDPTGTPDLFYYQWELVTDLEILDRDFVQTIAFDPFDEDIIYAGTRSSGIYKSVDGGINWAPSKEGITVGNIRQIIIDPQDSNVLFVNTLDPFGVFKSEDAGESWRWLDTQSTDCAETSGNTSYLFMNPADPDNLIFTDGMIVSITKDGGQNWKRLEIPFFRPGLVGIDPETGNLIVVTGREGTKMPIVIYLSDKDGSDWERVHRYFPIYDINYKYMMYDPIRADIFFSIGLEDMVSEDGGASWVGGDLGGGNLAISYSGTLMYTGWGSPNIIFSHLGPPGLPITNTRTKPISIAVSPANYRRIAVGCERDIEGGSLWISNSGGKAWDKREDGLGMLEMAFGFDETGSQIYIGQYTVGIFPEEEKIADFARFYVYNLEYGYYIPVSQDACGTSPSQPWEQAICGKSYASKHSNPALNWCGVCEYAEENHILIHDMVDDPLHEDVVFMATDAGVYRSIDDGASWKLINFGLDDTHIVYDLAFDPANPQDLYALTPLGIYKMILY